MSALPPKLERWRKVQQEAPEKEVAQEIIAEYFRFFGKKKASEELWVLTTGILTNQEMHQAQAAKDRHDLLFFFEFTKMVLEATHYLYAEKKGS